MIDAEQKAKIDIEMNDYTGDDEVVSSYDLKEMLEKQQEDSWRLATGIPTLDHYIEGIEGGELTTVSGITKHGKTLFCQSLTMKFIEQGVNPLWFQFEVPMRQFLKQFGDKVPLFYSPKMLKGKDINWIWKKIVEAKKKYYCDVVFIDHLHFLIDMQHRNMSMEIGQVMRYLKQIAVEWDIAIFLMAHIKKTKPDEELTIGDIRDSSFVEQESDNVFYIWRVPREENRSVLKIAANRRCGIMDKKIRLMKINNFLVEAEHES